MNWPLYQYILMFFCLLTDANWKSVLSDVSMTALTLFGFPFYGMSFSIASLSAYVYLFFCSRLLFNPCSKFFSSFVLILQLQDFCLILISLFVEILTLFMHCSPALSNLMMVILNSLSGKSDIYISLGWFSGDVSHSFETCFHVSSFSLTLCWLLIINYY